MDEVDGGYIRVGVRVRPPKSSATALEDSTMAVDEAEGTVTIEVSPLKYERFAFASVHQAADNAALYEAIGAPLLKSAAHGYNGTLLVYGQTGSGKTFTMGEVGQIGTAAEGMSHRMVRGLFELAAADRDHHYELGLQYVQIHLEKVYDLLGERPRNKDRADLREASEVALCLREDRAKGVQIQGVSTHRVASVEAALALMRQACGRLAFASTQMNKHSSRSHAFCTLHVRRTAAPSPPVLDDATAQPLSPGLTASGDGAHLARREAIACVLDDARVKHKLTEGRLTLVDLAGSEDVGRSGVTGQGLAEAKKINSSLLALGNVIHALTHHHAAPPAGTA